MIEVNNLEKEFTIRKRTPGALSHIRSLFAPTITKVKALDSLSFHVARGEIVGYIGQNGAGKSSTIKVLSGILTPSSGSCTINGIVPWKNRKQHVQNIGVIFGQKSQLLWDLPVIDTFSLLKEIYHLPTHAYTEELSFLAEVLEFSHLLNTPVRQLSLGQRMRCEIGAALIHRPDLLFLDEPTIGLDAISKKKERDLIKRLNNERNLTVFLTSHDTRDLEVLAHRIILIDQGKIVFNDQLSAFRKLASHSEDSLEDILIALYDRSHTDSDQPGGA